MSNSVRTKVRKISLGAAAVLAVAAAATLALPQQIHIERTALVAAPPELVYSALLSPASFHQFNPFRDVYADLKGTISGPAQGIGATYAWQSSGGNGSQTIVSMQPNTQIKMQLELGFRGRPTQTFRITPDGAGSKVSWIQDADLGYNPVARIIGLTLDGTLGPVYEQGLKKLSLWAATKTSQTE
jgi:uncharacterized protein YndB with AHSA1/START domain